MSNGGSSPRRSGGAAVDVDADMDMDAETLTNGSPSVDGGATPRPELINESAPVNIMPFLGRRESGPERYDVSIIGAGPAGLMLAYVPSSLLRKSSLITTHPLISPGPPREALGYCAH